MINCLKILTDKVKIHFYSIISLKFLSKLSSKIKVLNGSICINLYINYYLKISDNFIL